MVSDKISGSSPAPHPQPSTSTFTERRKLGRELQSSVAVLIDAIGVALNRLKHSDDLTVIALIKDCEQTIYEIAARLRALEEGGDV